MELKDRMTMGEKSGDIVIQMPCDSPKGHGISVLRGSHIKTEPILWIWGDYLAAGKLHILAGPPGTGKTTAALALAATLTAGGRWPDGSKATAGDVLIWSGEDDPGDTIIPRLQACGADLERIHIIDRFHDENGSRPVDPATDIAHLAQVMESIEDPKLLIVDPIVSAVGADSHKNGEVRRSLQPLVDLGMARRCAILGISHFTKGTMGRDPVERVTGSLAFGALPRIILGAVKQQDDGDIHGRRLIVRAKSNIGPDTGGFYYDLEPFETENGITTSRLLWGEQIEGSARDILAEAENLGADEEKTPVDEAVDWLREALADEPLTRKEVLQRAKDTGFSERTIDRAKSKAGVESSISGFGPKRVSMWTIPAIPANVRHTKNGGGNGDRGGDADFTGVPEGPIPPKPPISAIPANRQGIGDRGGNGADMEEF